MPVDYPLRFEPLFRRYLWGGRRLQSVLGKQIGEGEDFAESWEIVDHGADQSVVLHGALAGQTLNELSSHYPEELFGRAGAPTSFPLLFKFLDANDRLSIQVHPDDARAARLVPPERGKTEAWVILDAAADSYLYAGLRPGVDAATLRREIPRRTCELCVELIEPRVGDCFFLPAGVVHALGPGLLVAEIQQASDTTYRIYDWSRIGPDGKPRKLHIDEALDAIDYGYGPVTAQQPTSAGNPHAERLVACDQFVLDRWTVAGEERVGGDDRFHILAVIEGSLSIDGDPAQTQLERGGVVLLPAELGAVGVKASPRAVFLDAYLP
jgi:mannose-6-phosphate isomerase